MPVPTDPKEILKQLSEMDLDSDQTPEEIAAQDSGNQNDELKGKAAKAWHDLRGKLKVARGVIEELSKPKEQTSTGQAAAQTPSNATDRSAQAQAYLDALTMRAMQSTGIFDSNNRIVQMEVARLYQFDITQMERTRQAQADGDKTFDSVAAGFKGLDDSDKAAIKARMSGLSPLDRTNENVIKTVVHTYMGENLDKFSKPSKGGSSSEVAAASQVKARGGVGAGDFSVGSGKRPEQNPPTPEELKAMRVLRIPPERVDLYRKALAKKEAYMPR